MDTKHSISAQSLEGYGPELQKVRSLLTARMASPRFMGIDNTSKLMYDEGRNGYLRDQDITRANNVCDSESGFCLLSEYL